MEKVARTFPLGRESRVTSEERIPSRIMEFSIVLPPYLEWDEEPPSEQDEVGEWG